jgi:hypothetical protein
MPERRSARRLFLWTFLGFWLVCSAWSITSASYGPPDEVSHMIRAAGVVRGEIFATKQPGAVSTQSVQLVPESLVRDACFPMRWYQDASCTPEPGGSEKLVLGDTGAGSYNPVYYAVTGWPLRFWPDWTGIALSRMMTGAMVSALLAWAVVGAVRWFRSRALVAGILVAVTPMVMHLGGAINPDAVEIAVGVPLFVGLLALLHEQREGINKGTVAMVGASGAIMVTPRFTGVMWLLVILFVMLVPSSRARLKELVKSSTVRWWSLVVVLATIAAVAWTLVARTVNLTSALGPTMGFGKVLRLAIIDYMWPNIPDQMIGVMGWAETLMPRMVYVVWFCAAGVLLLGGFLIGRRVDRWRLLALFFGSFTPLLAYELYSAGTNGFFNQGRYFLTGAVGLPILAAYVMGRDRLTDAQVSHMTRLFAVILLPIQFVCLFITMDRYASGLQSLNPFNGPWQPPYGVVLPLVMTVVGLVVQYVALTRATRVPPRERAVTDEKFLVAA